MSKKKRILNTESSQRLRDWIREIGLTQSELAEAIGYTQQYVSNIMTGKRPITLDFAQLVSERTAQPSSKYNIERRIRPEYLLCLDNIRTTDDLQERFITFSDQKHNASLTMLDHSLKSICEAEGTEAPVIDNIPEILLLQSMLEDYSDSLMRQYLDRLRGNNSSHFWNIIDQIPDSSDSEHTP